MSDQELLTYLARPDIFADAFSYALKERVDPQGLSPFDRESLFKGKGKLPMGEKMLRVILRGVLFMQDDKRIYIMAPHVARMRGIKDLDALSLAVSLVILSQKTRQVVPLIVSLGPQAYRENLNLDVSHQDMRMKATMPLLDAMKPDAERLSYMTSDLRKHVVALD